ncbi:16172_t:CDS:2, partial [Dentiscutata erythropus]
AKQANRKTEEKPVVDDERWEDSNNLDCEQILETYESKLTVISRDKTTKKSHVKTKCSKVDDEVNQVSFLLRKYGFDVDYNKEIIASDRDKDLIVTFEEEKVVCYNDMDMLITTLQQDFNDHIGVMVSNQDYSKNAKSKANKFNILMCRIKNLVKMLGDHINYLKEAEKTEKQE